MYYRSGKGPVSKKAILYAALLSASLIVIAGCAPAGYYDNVSDQSDIDDVEYLSYYGDWVYTESYGSVWCPNVTDDWEPFYYGNWTWTDDGWAWTSYEPYGWLVYHYGTWGYQPGLGWFWVPGDTWYPAAVEWYTFDDYAAWAPMPPRGVMWPDPWDTYNGVNVWIVINVNNFHREDVGKYRMRIPNRRDDPHYRNAVRRPPDVQRVERVIRKTISPIELRKEPVRIRTRAVTRQETQEKAKQIEKQVEKQVHKSDDKLQEKLKKLVLPKLEQKKVERNAPRVKKEVLTRPVKKEEPVKKSTEDSNRGSVREKKKR